MLTIKGYYNGENIMALEEIPNHIKGNVIITFVEEEKSTTLLRDELTPSQYARLEKSIKQIENGEYSTHEEVMARVKAKKWLTK